MGVTRIMHNAPNRGVNNHIFQNNGNYPVIPIYAVEADKLCLSEIDKPEYTHVPIFNVTNVFECRRNNPDASYERAYMAAEDNQYFTDILDTQNKYQDRHGQRLSSKKLKEAVLRVMEQ